MKTIALLIILVFNVWNHGLLWISSKFISSKPPGRRMVTSSLNILLNSSLHAALLTFSLGLAVRIMFGHLSFWIVFLIVEVAMKMSFMLVAGVANFTRLVQISIVNNHSWVQNYNDKVPKINVIVLAIIFTFFLKEILYLARW